MSSDLVLTNQACRCIVVYHKGVLMEPMIPDGWEYVPKHRADLIYFDSEHLSIPAEVCEACSGPEDGLWVPASFCPEARADMERRGP